MAKKEASKPLVSIVVLNWNGLEDTKECIAAIRKLEYPNYELVVVDNGSRTDSKEYLSKLEDIIYVDNPVNRGFTGGHIDGLKHCSGEFVLLLNNDAVIKPDYLTKALEAFDDPKVAVVGGRSYFWNEEQAVFDETNSFYAYQTVNYITGEAFMASSDYNTQQVVNNVSGSAAMVRRSVIDEVGYLYNRFFAYFEETDLFARIKRAGYTVLYDPRLHIWHRNGASSGSSSGSHFFFYQIFRNRFIFAMRNFETRSLWRFLYIYSRIAAGSLARLILKPGTDKIMHKAYFQAAWYNFITLPVEIRNRRKLRAQLGKSTYNHILYTEQTGVSIIYDCTAMTTAQLQKLEKQITVDTNPQHEYILVVRGNHSLMFKKDTSNVRYVVDRQYFATNPLNLGCLAAHFDWMVLGDPHSSVISQLDGAIAQTMNTSIDVVAFGDPANLHPSLVLRKTFFEFIGGLQETDHDTLVSSLIAYAGRRKSLAWHHDTPQEFTAVQLSQPDAEQRRLLEQKINFDTAIAENGRLSLWGKIKTKYYRIYQFTSIFRWLFLKQVSLYLKAARIKNLLLFTVTLRRKALALELKHIRNEVIIHTTPGDLAHQKEVTKRRLEELRKSPGDMPVFIICRDRVDGLKELVAWLEKHNLKKIVFIDNDSVYPPLVEYFENTPYQVLKLYRNVGHTSPWKLSLTRTLAPEDFYIVSDPDVIPTEECPQDVIQHFLDIHKKHFMYMKVGFGLRIDDLPDHYPLKRSVIEWEEQFWKNKLEDGVFEAGVDTTFAVYKPFSYNYKLHPSIRTDFPYVARHLPWYADPAKISEEEKHYRFRADHNVSSWNVDELEDRYAKEMKRNKKKQ